MAALDGDEATAELAAKCKRVFDHVDGDDPSALLKAIDDEVGGQADFQDAGGRTALMQACIRGKRAMVEALLEKRADICVQDDEGDNALMFAISQGHDDLTTLCIESGTDVCVPNKLGQTPLMKATARENLPVMRQLLDAKAFADATALDGKTALVNAVERNLPRVVETLMEGGASAATTDKMGATPLFPAAFRNNTEIMRVLLEHRADITAAAKSGTALMMAVDAPSFKVATMKFLIDNGCPMDAKNVFGSTALMMAVEGENELAVKVLLKSKADVSVKDADGKTAADLARDRNLESLLKLLEETGTS